MERSLAGCSTLDAEHVSHYVILSTQLAAFRGGSGGRELVVFSGDLVPWLTPDLEFTVVLAGAEAAGVRVYPIIVSDLEDGDEREPGDSPADLRWPSLLGLTDVSWSVSPTDLGLARAGEVIWPNDSCDGSDWFCPMWGGLLHEVAHAATGGPGGPVGGESDASAWEWRFAASVFGPLSPQARVVRAWSLESGIDQDAIRFSSARPTAAVIKAAREALLRGSTT